MKLFTFILMLALAASALAAPTIHDRGVTPGALGFEASIGLEAGYTMRLDAHTALGDVQGPTTASLGADVPARLTVAGLSDQPTSATLSVRYWPTAGDEATSGTTAGLGHYDTVDILTVFMPSENPENIALFRSMLQACLLRNMGEEQFNAALPDVFGTLIQWRETCREIERQKRIQAAMDAAQTVEAGPRVIGGVQ